MTDKIDTTPEPVEQAIGELTDLTRCRCHEGFTSRNLRDPDCNCDSADAVKTVSTRIEELEGPCAKPGITKGGPRLMEQHEILNDYIGDCPCYTPNGDGIMEADIDGEWVRMADVEANILRKVNAHKSEEDHG